MSACQCGEGSMTCGDECINTQFDQLHCGECDNPCPNNGLCRGGTCVGGGPPRP
jgi:hypothetical protein